MRGGKRDGAGRKPAEETVRMSIPLSLVPHIKAFIEAYKQDELNFDQIIKNGAELNKRQKIKNKSNKTSVDDQPEADKLTQLKHVCDEVVLNDDQTIKNQTFVR